MLSDTLKKNIIFINSARVIACFFIAQERAQYRAEAHDMEVSEMEMKQVYEALEKVENGTDHPLFLFLSFIISDPHAFSNRVHSTTA